MLAAEGHRPARQTDTHLLDGKLKEHLREYLLYLPLVYLKAVDGHNGHAVFIGQRGRHAFCLVGFGLRAVQQDDKRLLESL